MLPLFTTTTTHQMSKVMNLDLTPVTIFVMPVFCWAELNKYNLENYTLCAPLLTSRILGVELQVFHQKSLRGCDLNVVEEVCCTQHSDINLRLIGALSSLEITERGTPSRLISSYKI